MKFGLIHDPEGAKSYVMNDHECQKFYSTEAIGTVRQFKLSMSRRCPNAIYQIVEFETKKKIYGLKLVKACDPWRQQAPDMVVARSKTQILANEELGWYLTSDIEEIKKFKKGMSEEFFGCIYTIWDIDLDQEAFLGFDPQIDKKYLELIKWLTQ